MKLDLRGGTTPYRQHENRLSLCPRCTPRFSANFKSRNYCRNEEFVSTDRDATAIVTISPEIVRFRSERALDRNSTTHGSEEENHNRIFQSSRGPLISALVVFLCFLIAQVSYAKLIIDLDSPSLAKLPVAVPDFSSDESGPLSGRELATILKNDLELTGLFQIIDNSPFPILTSDGRPDFESCSRAGAQAVVTGKFQFSNGQAAFEGRSYDVALKKM